MESEAYEFVDSAEKQNIADEFDHLFAECILPPAKEILGSKTAGKRKITHEELTSPEHQILEAALAIGTDMEANAEIFKKATKELQRLKNAKFDLFSDEVLDESE